MRIEAHFAGRRPRLAAPLAVLAWTVALAAAAAAAWLAVEARELRAERSRLEVRVARTQAQLGAAASAQLPSDAELAALRSRVQALNKLSGLRGWGTAQLLGWLGRQLPDNVYLVSLHHRPREGEALIVAESPSAEALTRFLLRLEREPQFAEVLLARQGARAEGGSTAVQFEVRVRWKS